MQRNIFPCVTELTLPKNLIILKKIKITVLVTAVILIVATIGTLFFVIKWNEHHQPEYIYIDVTEDNKNETIN